MSTLNHAAECTSHSHTGWFPCGQVYTEANACLTCGAEPFEPCTARGKVKADTHKTRYNRGWAQYRRDLRAAPPIDYRIVGKNYASVPNTWTPGKRAEHHAHKCDAMCTVICSQPQVGLPYVVALQKIERVRHEAYLARQRTTFNNVAVITDEVVIELLRGDLIAA